MSDHGTIPTPTQTSEAIVPFARTVATILGDGDVDIRRLLSILSHDSGRLVPVLTQLFRNMLVMRVYRVVIDPSESVDTLLERAYCSGDEVIKKMKPSGSYREVDIEFIPLARWGSTEEAIQEIATRGYRPADFWELLAFAASIRASWYGLTAVALGSCMEDSYPVLVLDTSGYRHKIMYIRKGHSLGGELLAIVRVPSKPVA